RRAPPRARRRGAGGRGGRGRAAGRGLHAGGLRAVRRGRGRGRADLRRRRGGLDQRRRRLGPRPARGVRRPGAGDRGRRAGARLLAGGGGPAPRGAGLTHGRAEPSRPRIVTSARAVRGETGPVSTTTEAPTRAEPIPRGWAALGGVLAVGAAAAAGQPAAGVGGRASAPHVPVVG